MPAPRLTTATAARWTVPSRWVRRLLLIGWVIAVVIAVVSDTAPCSDAVPSRCGPDHAGAFWLAVVCLGTPVLLLWMPLAGCLAGAAFALADLHYDDVPEARLAFAVHGALSALAAVSLLRAGRRQDTVLGATAQDVRVNAGAPAWDLSRLAAAGLLAVLGAASFGWFLAESARHDTHLDRAVPEVGRVLSVDDGDARVRLAVEDRTVEVEVLEADDYPVGSSTTVLLDPVDEAWVALLAELPDPTGWEALAYAAWALGGILTAREWQRRRALTRLGRRPLPTIAVRALLRDHEAVVLAVDGDEPVARLPLVPTPTAADRDRVAEDFGRLWRDEEPLGPPTEPVAPVGALLIGDLHDRGFAVLVVDGSALEPAGPLRRWDDGWQDDLHDDEQDDELDGLEEDPDDDPYDGFPPGRLVVPADGPVLPQLPVACGPGAAAQRTGWLMLLGGLLGGPVAVSAWSGWAVPALVLAGQLVVSGATRAFATVRLAHDALRVREAWRAFDVPWERVHGARRDEEQLLLGWYPDHVHALPLDDASRVQETGELVEALRRRALSAGDPGRQVTWTLGAAWLPLALLAAGSAVAAHL